MQAAILNFSIICLPFYVYSFELEAITQMLSKICLTGINLDSHGENKFESTNDEDEIEK